jgi:hypothetical protein
MNSYLVYSCACKATFAIHDLEILFAKFCSEDELPDTMKEAVSEGRGACFVVQWNEEDPSRMARALHLGMWNLGALPSKISLAA